MAEEHEPLVDTPTNKESQPPGSPRSPEGTVNCTRHDRSQFWKYFRRACVLLLMAGLLESLQIYKRSGSGLVVPSLSGPPVMMGAGTYPRANHLSDGSIIGTHTTFEAGDNVIVATRSTDGGTTWSRVGEVARGRTAQHDIDNPYILQLPSGRLLVAFRNHDRKGPDVYTYFRITVCFSDNHGVNWAFLSEPAQDHGRPNGDWEPFLRNAGDGSLQLYYSRENSAVDQDSIMRNSNDGGITWSGPRVISGGELNANRDGMLGVAIVTGTILIAVFETKRHGGRFNVMAINSPDDGVTWGNRRTIFTPSTGDAGAPQVVNVGGTLVVSFQTDEGTPGRYAANIITSGDGGKTWGNRLTWSNATSLWPSLIVLDDNSLLAMVEHGGAQVRKITLG